MEKLGSDNNSFSHQDTYKDLVRGKLVNHAENMRVRNESIDEEAVSAQVRSLDRLLNGKSEAEVTQILAHSLQDNELNRLAVERWRAEQNVIDLEAHRRSSSSEEHVA